MLKMTWNLENIFSGGVESPELQTSLQTLHQDIQEYESSLKEMKENVFSDLTKAVMTMQKIDRRLLEVSSFLECLCAQDQFDQAAMQKSGFVKELYAQFSISLTIFDEILQKMEDSVFEDWMKDSEIAQVRFSLEERRILAKEKMSPEKEALVEDLSVNGYHAWSELYNLVVSRVTIPYEKDEKLEYLSAGQAENKLHDPNRLSRIQLFQAWEKAWSDQADLFTQILNHISGYRLKMYQHRKWESAIQEPLGINRMSRKTLERMWQVIEKNKPALLKYFEKKSEYLGINQLGWADVEAPITSETKHATYAEAKQTIVEAFQTLNPKMAAFSLEAFEKEWIEAEDRAGKRPGGFCTSFPVSKESRIFMTFSGTNSNVSTLAHELGHAFHQSVMDDLPMLSQHYAMNVAETASTYAEMVLGDHLLKRAQTNEEKIGLLDDKLQRAAAFCMNIHARFIFESSFYEERKQGMLSREQLCVLMENAQKEAYLDSLSHYHPYFWASKLHFYMTDVPFYNFPYTFGYLFSMGIYSLALKEGAAFEEKYIRLLQDTGRMSVEELAMKHLKVDLTEADFWQEAMDKIKIDIEEFAALF